MFGFLGLNSSEQSPAMMGITYSHVEAVWSIVITWDRGCVCCDRGKARLNRRCEELMEIFAGMPALAKPNMQEHKKTKGAFTQTVTSSSWNDTQQSTSQTKVDGTIDYRCFILLFMAKIKFKSKCYLGSWGNFKVVCNGFLKEATATFYWQFDGIQLI